VVLGDAELGGLCEEGALAFKEICQLPSNYYHLLDVRHGPMVLVGPETLVIAVLSSGGNELELALVRDALKKGATVVVYSDQPLNLPGAVVISFGEVLLPPARGVPAIALCQLISYHKSFLTGADPDKPDGLSPWIRL
jgi:fructoselysine-6-P-deglycase FrlB-like protein